MKLMISQAIPCYHFPNSLFCAFEFPVVLCTNLLTVGEIRRFLAAFGQDRPRAPYRNREVQGKQGETGSLRTVHTTRYSMQAIDILIVFQMVGRRFLQSFPHWARG